MISAIPQVQSRFTSLLAGKMFDLENSDQQVEMRFFPMGLRPKRYTLSHDYPCTEISVRSGKDTGNQSTFLVDVIVGFHINPDRDGDSDVDQDDDQIIPAYEMLEFIVKSVRALFNNGNYHPFSLEKILWQIGDENGNHPGPDNYIVPAVLEFQQDPGSF